MSLLKCFNTISNSYSIINKKSNIDTFENDSILILNHLKLNNSDKIYSYKIDNTLPVFKIFEEKVISNNGWIYNTKTIKKSKILEISLCNINEEFTKLYNNIQHTQTQTIDDIHLELSVCKNDLVCKKDNDNDNGTDFSDDEYKKYEYIDQDESLNDYFINYINKSIKNITTDITTQTHDYTTETTTQTHDYTTETTTQTGDYMNFMNTSSLTHMYTQTDNYIGSSLLSPVLKPYVFPNITTSIYKPCLIKQVKQPSLWYNDLNNILNSHSNSDVLDELKNKFNINIDVD